MAKTKRGYFGSTEPQARDVLTQIEKTRKKRVKKKKAAPKSKQRKIYEKNNQ